MILPYRGKGNFPIKGGPCGVVDVSLPAASPFMRRVLSPEPVGEGQCPSRNVKNTAPPHETNGEKERKKET